MASSSTYAFFHCHYAFQKFPFFCVTLCVLHALQNATESHSAERATHTISVNKFFSWISSIFVGFFKSSRFFVSSCTYYGCGYEMFVNRTGKNDKYLHSSNKILNPINMSYLNNNNILMVGFLPFTKLCYQN